MRTIRVRLPDNSEWDILYDMFVLLYSEEFGAEEKDKLSTNIVNSNDDIARLVKKISWAKIMPHLRKIKNTSYVGEYAEQLWRNSEVSTGNHEF